MKMLRLFNAACILHILIVNQFTGTQVTLGPTKEVILKTTFNQTVTCTLSFDEKNTETGGLILMQIIHSRLIGQSTNEQSFGERKVWASVLDREAAKVSEHIPAGLQAVAGGQLLNEQGFDDELTLTWNSANVQCVDAGAFDCVVFYLQKPDFSVAQWNSSSSSLEILKVQDINIHLAMNSSGFDDDDDSATFGNPLELQEGDVVELTCTADIGVDRNTLIDWSNLQPSSNDGDWLMKFTPSGLVQQPATDNGCGYTKVESFTYNITRADVQRGNKLGFACNISYIEFGNPQEKMISSRAFYIQPYTTSTTQTATTDQTTTTQTATTTTTQTGSNNGTNGGSNGGTNDGTNGGTNDGTNAGAIAGGEVGSSVMIVLIALFLSVW